MAKKTGSKAPQDFVKKHDFLICVDSDGCAVDTMDIKHFRCFGPCMVAEWGLEKWQEPILERWNVINLYSLTRGINRFLGLSMALSEINDQYTPIEGIDTLKAWAENAKELSNPALEAEIERLEAGHHDGQDDPDYQDAAILKKALAWSKAVNASIAQLPWEVKKAFPGVKEGFEAVKDFADIAIVSAANRDAVEEEWDRFGLLPLVDVMMCQDVGNKAHCISVMLEKGYAPDHVLMCGDAPGDKAAAEKNGVFYYPILVRHEKESWNEFPHAASLLREGAYAPYGEVKAKEFIDNLTK
ncbi:MAG: HAD family hydrolase [Firmicutes bacterium]|nr:HAD family hydrolase [Bacillota bacterium]